MIVVSVIHWYTSDHSDPDPLFRPNRFPIRMNHGRHGEGQKTLSPLPPHVLPLIRTNRFPCLEETGDPVPDHYDQPLWLNIYHYHQMAYLIKRPFAYKSWLMQDKVGIQYGMRDSHSECSIREQMINTSSSSQSWTRIPSQLMTSLAKPRKDLVLAIIFRSKWAPQIGSCGLCLPTLLIASEEDGASQPLWLGSSHLI